MAEKNGNWLDGLFTQHISTRDMSIAEEIVRALGGRWNRDSGMCRCPAHEDRNPSLSVEQHNGSVLVHCHAGCPQDAVLDALAAQGLDIRRPNGVNSDGHISDYRHPELGKPSHVWTLR